VPPCFILTAANLSKPLVGLTVGHFGHYDPAYARNRNLGKALRRAGASVIDIRDRRRFPARTLRLARLGRHARPDVILVGFPGQSDVATAKLAALGRPTPVVLDALVSLWETNVIDRQTIRRRSLAGYRYRMTDRVACSLADAIIVDTDARIAWWRDAFAVPVRKLHRIWVGADDELMTPCPARPPADVFTVFFYGTFIPLHGVETIIGAAHRLQQRDPVIRFVLCGTGQTRPAMQRLVAERHVANVTFLDRRPTADLRALICDSDLCLGIFGTGPKARTVIPNKVFDALACGRPVITADTPAAREALTHGRDVYLCPAGDPDALAEAIAALMADGAARTRIAAAGHELFRRAFSLDALATQIGQLVLDVVEDPTAVRVRA
jgi:glycosyltransferase involved in cell wall biosynthesis